MRIALALAFFLSLIVPMSAAARVEGIAAVVNEDAITMSDVEDRMQLIIASSGLPNTKEIKTRLAGQVIASLIEEQIKLQEGLRLELPVTQEEIDAGFAAIAQQNNFAPEQFQGILAQAGINIMTLRRQIESQIAWTKVVQQKLRPRVNVSDKDIDDVFERMRANAGKTEYLLSEIFLPVEDAKGEADTRQLAVKLVSEITDNKAPFGKVAQQFSKSPAAAEGGDMGWVQEGQLPQELDGTIKAMTADNISQPVRSVSGYHILYLREARMISDATLPSREQVLTTLGTQRLEREQRRYYLDLKAAAFIENRVQS